MDMAAPADAAPPDLEPALLPHGWSSIALAEGSVPAFAAPAVWYGGPGDIWVVFNDVIQHWDGTAWSDSPHPATHFLSQLWGSGASDVWAVGSGGDFLHFDGKSWTRTPAPAVSQFSSLWGSGPSDVWAVGSVFNGPLNTNIGTVVHYDGARWSEVPLPEPALPVSIRGTGPADVWLVGSDASAKQARVFHYDGTGFSRVPFPITGSPTLRSVWPLSASSVWVGGLSGLLAQWDGTSWVSQTSPLSGNIVSLFSSEPGVLWASDAQQSARFDGKSWQLLPSLPSSGGPVSMSGALADVWAVATTDYRSGEGPYVLSHWNGSAWALDSALRGVIQPGGHIWGSGPHDVWLATGGAVAHWDGVALRPVAAAAGPAIWGSGPTDIWAAGAYGIFHSDGGAFKRVQAAASSPLFTAAWGSGSADLFLLGSQPLRFDGAALGAVPGAPLARQASAMWGSLGDAWVGCGGQLLGPGTAGSLFHWDGAALTPDKTVSSYHVNGIWGSAHDDIWAVGEAPNLLHFDGTAWSPVKLDTSAALNGIWGSARDSVWAVGAAGLVLHFDGTAWTHAAPGPGGTDLMDVWGSGPDDLWVLSRLGNGLLHYRP